MANRDSGLEHSIGPMTPGHDLLPVDVTSSGHISLSPPIPVLSLRSNQPLPDFADSQPRKPEPSVARPRSPGEVFLDGDVIMCACPDCQAPMSVRLWLMMAECWRCNTAIELNEEQERQAMRLLAEREAKQRPVPPPAPPRPAATTTTKPTIAAAPVATVATPPPSPAPPPPAPTPRPVEKPRTAPAAEHPTAPLAAVPTALVPPAPPPPASPSVRRPTSAPAAAAASQPVPRRRPAAARRRVTKPLTAERILKMTPAWLISMLVQLLIITLLAIFTTEDEKQYEPLIVLNASVSTESHEEGETHPVVKVAEAKFDMPVEKKDLNNEKLKDVLLKANQDALELRVDSDAAALPDLDVLKEKITTTAGGSYSVAARDPRLRAELVTHEGGTTLTEAAVARGLRWLSMHQNEDGSWSLSGFNRAAGCNCNGNGAIGHKSPGTALALLPFLGAGQTHLVGRYQANVSRGLRWLLEHQEKDGDLRGGAHDNTGMYTQGQAAIVLCEAFAMTGDEQLRVPAQRAIDFICKAQYTDGGWRYQPTPRNQPGDTSVVGWQLMALQSARAANLTVPEETLLLASQYFDSVQHNSGSRYGYMKNQSPTPTMTAEALLCRMYLGWGHDEMGLVRGTEYLAESHLPRKDEPNIYYWYYGTQTMHHVGGRNWESWNTRMRDILTQTQETEGHQAGSWDPRGEHSNVGGRIYMTSLAICTLEVYYRHLPIFRQIELERK